MATAKKQPWTQRSPRSRVLTVVAVALLVFVALSVAAYLRFDAAYFQRVLISQVERRYDVNFELSDYAVTLWPRLGLELHDVTITDKAPDTRRPLLTMESARVLVRPIPILWGRFDISEIVLTGLDLYLVRRADGKFNLPKNLLEEDEKDEAAGNGFDLAGRLFLTRTKLSGGKATLVDLSKGGLPVTTRVARFDLQLKNLAYGYEPEFKLDAIMGNPSPGARVDLAGRLGQLERGKALSDLFLDIDLESEAFDVGRFSAYLPEGWKRRVRSGVLTSDLLISGSVAEGLSVKGDLRVEKADLGDSYRLTGTIAGKINFSGGEGVTRGLADLQLSPGTFTQGSMEIDGETRVKADLQTGKGQFRASLDVDATKAAYRQGDVLEKEAGTHLTLEGLLRSATDGLRVENAVGRIGDLPFTGSAEIGKPVAEGRSTPFALHFAPEKVALDSLHTLVAATAPFALGGEAVFSKLDIVRRPEEAREYQVSMDFRLSNASARFPLEDGTAHTVENLAAEVTITPGMLQTPGASAIVNGAPVDFQVEAEEFMAMIAPDPSRPRANVRLEVSKDFIDLDQLLKPASAAPPGQDAGEGPGAGAGVALAQPGGTGGGEAVSEEIREASDEEAPETPGSAEGNKAAPSKPFVERFFVKNGMIRAARAIYAEQPMSDLEADFTYHAPVLDLREVTFKQAEGSWKVKGTVALNGATTYDLAVEAADARVELLAEAFSKNDKPSRIFGILDGKAELHGQGSDLAAWEKTLRGSGEIVVRDGRLPGFNIYEVVIQAVLGVVGRIVPVGKLGGLSQENTFEVFEQSFRIESGRIWSEDIHLETVDYDLNGKGSAGLDQTLDYETTVQLTASGTQKMFTVASLPILLHSKAKISPVPVRITGTTEKPTIVPDSSVISLGTLKAVLRGVGGVPGGGAAIVTEGIKGGLKSILGGGDKGSGGGEAEAPGPPDLNEGAAGRSGESPPADPAGASGASAQPEESGGEEAVEGAKAPEEPEETPDLVETGIKELRKFLGR